MRNGDRIQHNGYEYEVAAVLNTEAPAPGILYVNFKRIEPDFYANAKGPKLKGDVYQRGDGVYYVGGPSAQFDRFLFTTNGSTAKPFLVLRDARDL